MDIKSQRNLFLQNKWSYPEGIELNNYGQLSCDGFCPPEALVMVNSEGKILIDSIAAYYKVVDTTHQVHSISCIGWCYKWGGTDFVEVVRKPGDSVFYLFSKGN